MAASICSLDGSTAFVTGASSQRGAHLPRVLHGAGARVVLAAHWLVQLTKQVAVEPARYNNIRANALCPGSVLTPINREFVATEAGRAVVKRIPQRRLGMTGDLTGPLLLTSPAGAPMTGATLVVDGGHSVNPL